MCDSKHCESNRIAHVDAKCSDLCSMSFPNLSADHDGYVPKGMNIGGGDYIDFYYCLDCGKIQGEFPVTNDDIEETLAKMNHGKYA